LIFSTTFSFIILIAVSLFSRKVFANENLIVPISILVIHYVTLTMLLVLVRISIKLVYQGTTSSHDLKKKVLVYGAGSMGVIVKRVIQGEANGKLQIVGYLDDSSRLQGKKLDGILIYNPKVLKQAFIKQNSIKTMIFAIRNISPDRKSEILRSALYQGLEVLEPPLLDTWLNGNFQINQIEKIKLENLLGRAPIQLNMNMIARGLNRKVILVTGAAGSIGSEIVRQVTRFNVRKLILVDQAETPMFHLENELRSSFSRCPVELILADVTNIAKMEQIFSEFHPDVVFHAAAYKHVPLMEENPHEAIRVNVGGTRLITGLSMKYGVKKFVMVSTDKAVNPTNVMGATKRMCEMIVQFRADSLRCTCQFIVTRFGNVLGSNGSVIPIFTRQIESGGPVTVTHPEMTRYFMTIPEACQLVLEAGFMGKGGEIFVFDMGKPVKIADLANQMIRLSGLIPDKDIKIIYTGLRPGEKLYEELLTDSEQTKATHHPKIKIARLENLNRKEIMVRIEALLNNLYSLSKSEVVNYCHSLVPEFRSSNNKYIRQHEKHEPIVAEDKAKTDLIRQLINKSRVQQ
jgi:FlaA1/EpsC-like NDP-sugar epimerase